MNIKQAVYESVTPFPLPPPKNNVGLPPPRENCADTHGCQTRLTLTNMINILELKQSLTVSKTSSANYPFDPKYHKVEAFLQKFDYKTLLDVLRLEAHHLESKNVH